MNDLLNTIADLFLTGSLFVAIAFGIWHGRTNWRASSLASTR